MTDTDDNEYHLMSSNSNAAPQHLLNSPTNKPSQNFIKNSQMNF